MAEFIAFVRGSGSAEDADGADGAGAAGAADAEPPRHRIAVLVVAPAASLTDLDARLEAAWAAPDAVARAAAAGADPDAGAVGAEAVGADGDDADESGADADADADAERLRRLSWLAGAGVRCHAVVVDRRESAPDGGGRPGASARRIVHGAIHEAIAGAGRDTEVRTGAADVAALAAGLARHAAARYEADLFRPEPPVRAADPDAAPMRLAGLIARRLERGWRDGATREGAPALGELLRAGWLTLEVWPPAPDRDPPARDAGADASDAAVRRVAVESAWRFIAEAPFPRDEDGRIQRIVLTHLLSTALYGDGGYASSGELLELLASRGYENLKEHYLQSAIVAGLRDSGVLVTSSSQGYKIPQDRQDVTDFVNLVDGQVIPLLERLARVRRTLGAAGEGGADWVLGDGRHARLRRAMDALEDGAPSGDASPGGR